MAVKSKEEYWKLLKEKAGHLLGDNIKAVKPGSGANVKKYEKYSISTSKKTSGLEDYLKDYYKGMQSAQLARLKAAREKALAGLKQQMRDVDIDYQNIVNALNQSREQAKYKYRDMRNRADVVNMQEAQRIKEMMANMGLMRGGENIRENYRLAAARQNALSDINLQEQMYYQDIDRRLDEAMRERVNELNKIRENINLLKSQGLAEENALIQQLQAERARALMDLAKYADAQQFREKEFAERIRQFDLSRKDTLAAQKALEAYRNAQLGLSREQLKALEAYRNAQLGLSRDKLSYQQEQDKYKRSVEEATRQAIARIYKYNSREEALEDLKKYAAAMSAKGVDIMAVAEAIDKFFSKSSVGKNELMALAFKKAAEIADKGGNVIEWLERYKIDLIRDLGLSGYKQLEEELINTYATPEDRIEFIKQKLVKEGYLRE